MNNKIRVLISDDNNEFANTLSSFLEKDSAIQIMGIANDGEEALKLIEEIQPDVVLLDVIMPHLDGLGVLERINAMNLNNRPICIMLSAVGQDKITQRAIELGAQYYVVKPFDIQVLIKRIKELKNLGPVTPTRNNYVMKEQKQQYIEIPYGETKNEEARSWPQTNVLKVGHHGSNTSSSQSFLDQVKPQIAVISVGKGNKYGHPKQVILDRLNKMEIKIYRTDESGNILVTSDGSNIQVETNVK